MWKGASPKIFSNAKDLRDKTTKEEEHVVGLRNNKLEGYKFRRQHPLNIYADLLS
jgi:very-short-patch-repair endonuclease